MTILVVIATAMSVFDRDDLLALQAIKTQPLELAIDSLLESQVDQIFFRRGVLSTFNMTLFRRRGRR